jgi:UDP-N-acetyl-2-amino-2-deoxyglucuronate dehydrogenase
MAKNFAVTGVGGFIAPRHLRAIRETGNKLIAAVDPKDSVGILDAFSFDVRFFTEVERFDRHLEKLRRGPPDGRLNYLSVCSPNYLHDAHCRLGLRVGADVICEKPLVINPWNLGPLLELESESGRRIYMVLQLRVHPKLIELRKRLSHESPATVHRVVLTYITARGPWYDVSWKGIEEKSGGIATNIGIHFFDLLVWLFGEVEDVRVHWAQRHRMAGFLVLERARVQWFLSVDPADAPVGRNQARTAVRSITVDGEELDFFDGFDGLHTRVYEDVLAGRGYGIAAARISIELVHRIRTAPISPLDDGAHPRLRGRM